MQERFHWSDLPDDNIESILGYSNKNTQELKAYLLAYHDLDKTDVDLIQLRVDRLEDLIEHIYDWCENNITTEVKIKHLHLLRKTAEEKRNYLLKIQEIIDQDLSVADLKEAYHHDTRELLDLRFKAIYLNKSRYYSIKKGEYWGDFWWVSVDPCHRQLSSYLRLWEKQTKSQKASDFFLWLEAQEVPRHQPYEEYLTPDKAKSFVYKVSSGKIISKEAERDEINRLSPDKKYLFVLGLDLNLYIAQETHSMFHSCFTQGKPVLCAGKITLEQGKIQTISLESGHYIPGIDNCYQFLSILKEQGYYFDAPISITFFHDRNQYTKLVEFNNEITKSEFEKILKLSTQKCEGV